jgi:hypothetical protein
MGVLPRIITGLGRDLTAASISARFIAVVYAGFRYGLRGGLIGFLTDVGRRQQISLQKPARAVHFNSFRRDKPFVTINCGAIPTDLLESEFFGHIKGPFTGEAGHKPGKAESAGSGTLFLVEIGEKSFELQLKLLRLIQSGEIEKVGAAAPCRVDVRIIAATRRNLRGMIEDGAFREDLPGYLRREPPPAEALRHDLRPDGISLKAVEEDLILRMYRMERTAFADATTARCRRESSSRLCFGGAAPLAQNGRRCAFSGCS